ncbi:hypothetical protein HHI36_017707 [Cryptolaemus montrouzieri]|uniref:Lipase n=1 Tax=Cryptolaemus montrouzieri TaxID=559131 RepID=A0ABD2NNC6_9CUCU
MYNFTSNCFAEITRFTKNCITERGYPVEEHSVTTNDGYINSMFRIPHGKRKQSNDDISRPPVLLCHGLTCSCTGTTFSRKHVKWNPEINKDEYWNFSWHEIAIYDLPAFVDYILEKTGFDKLFFIGHSQGATVYAAFVSRRPEYNQKVALCCLLGPPIIFENTNGFRIKFVSNLIIPLMETLHNFLGLPIYELPFIGLARFLGLYSKPNTMSHTFLQSLLFFLAGNSNYDQTSKLDFTKFCYTTPNAGSMRQIYHYSQIMRNNRFAEYDYGLEENMKVYGSPDPPLYDLSKVVSPVALFYSRNDMYTDHRDMAKLEQLLGNVVYKHEVAMETFNHLDFLAGNDSIFLLYRHISKIMKKYI